MQRVEEIVEDTSIIEAGQQRNPRLRGIIDQGLLQTERQIYETIADRTIAAIFQRDEISGVDNRGKTQQSLELYSIDGTPVNPVSAEKTSLLRTEIAQKLEVKTARLSREEKDVMAFLLPQLVGTLVLDEQYVDKVYEKDFGNIIDIALDWYLSPHAVGDTHIRIGYGGEEKVSSRAPAYLVPALETLKRLHSVYGNYTNWALNRELFVSTQNSGDEVNEWIRNQLQEDHVAMYGEPATAEELDNEKMKNNKLTAGQVHRVLVWAWQRFTGSMPNFQAINEKYHIPTELPKIVVFNAAHAAIEINRMDSDLVLESRNRTQQYLRAYVRSYYPEFDANLVFQNDRPWEEHDLYTRLRILHAYDLITSHNGLVTDTRNRLAQFEKHHRRDVRSDQNDQKSGAASYNLPPYDLYASFHPFFFEDPLKAGQIRDQMEKPNIMESIPAPRITIYHQGPPEIVFGVFRKLYAENATATDFRYWLEQRRRTIKNTDKYSAYARSIYELGSSITDTTVPFQKGIGKIIDAVIGKNNGAKKIYFDFLRSDAFRSSEDQQQAFNDFVSTIMQNTPSESMEELGDVISYMDQQLFEAQQVQDAFYDLLKGKAEPHYYELIERHINKIYPAISLETIVKVGAEPVYYPLEGADAIMYPNGEETSAERYDQHLEAQKNKSGRLRGTTGYITKQVMNGTVPEETIRDNIPEHAELVPLATELFCGLHEHIDNLEQEGENPDQIHAFVMTRIEDIKQSIRQRVVESNGTEPSEKINTVVEQIALSAAQSAQKRTMEAVSVEVFKAIKVREDYVLYTRAAEVQSAIQQERARGLKRKEQYYSEQMNDLVAVFSE